MAGQHSLPFCVGFCLLLRVSVLLGFSGVGDRHGSLVPAVQHRAALPAWRGPLLCSLSGEAFEVYGSQSGLALISCTLESYPGTSLPVPGCWNTSAMFSPRSFKFSDFKFGLWIHFDWLLYRARNLGRVSVFGLRMSSVPQRHILFCVCDIFVEIQSTELVCPGLSGIGFCPVGPGVCMSMPCCLTDCGSVKCLEIRYYEASNVLLAFTQDCFGYLEWFLLPHEFWGLFWHSCGNDIDSIGHLVYILCSWIMLIM